MIRASMPHEPGAGFAARLLSLSWPFVLLLALLAAAGAAMLYSVGGGSWQPWALAHVVRFGIGAVVLVGVALVAPRVWVDLAYPVYGATLMLLGAVEFAGYAGMGAQRWIHLGLFQLQPSELMKASLVLALARYYHVLPPGEVSRPRRLLPPLGLILAPVAFVANQPDLGTAILLLAVGAAVMFLAGVRYRYFLLAFVLTLAAVPAGWSVLRDYQKERIFAFLDPGLDPLGVGYHVLQSRIAFGAGGVFGRGFGQGTQNTLNFLPEKHTDFIFTILAEEFGLTGGLTMLGLYALVLLFLTAVALQCRHQFGRLLVMGLGTSVFLSVFVNTSMVMGLVPVVGVPLPLISYGGSSMLTLMFSFGLVLCIHAHRNADFGVRGLR